MGLPCALTRRSVFPSSPYMPVSWPRLHIGFLLFSQPCLASLFFSQCWLAPSRSLLQSILLSCSHLACAVSPVPQLSCICRAKFNPWPGGNSSALMWASRGPVSVRISPELQTGRTLHCPPSFPDSYSLMSYQPHTLLWVFFSSVLCCCLRQGFSV